MFVPPREIQNLGDLGFGHLVSENAAYPHTVLVDMQHYCRRFLAGLLEEPFEDVDDEFHGRVVVVQQKYPIDDDDHAARG